MKLIVGLGNPDEKYKGTRHNSGAMVVQELAGISKGSFQKSKHGQVAEIKIGKEKVVIATLNYFMNESGKGVKPLMKENKVSIGNLVVVVDDFQLPLGSIRLRARGSSGGHKGLQSVISALGSEEFCRLRIGTGRKADEPAPPSEKWNDFVLTPFTPKEKPILKKVLAKAADALKMWVNNGPEKAMSLFNN